MNLFVSNIDYKITEDQLKELFAEYGEVTSVIILKDMDDQKPKGYGFVMMSSSYEGQKCVMRLNHRKINDRALSVEEARPKPGEEPEKKERILRPRRNRASKDK
jgi:RNA recognition motif-containing protein